MDRKLQPIDSTDLSVRCKNALQRSGIHTIGDLLERSEDNLRGIRNLGAKSLDEILAKIISLNAEATAPSVESMDFDEWIKIDTNRKTVTDYLKNKNITTDAVALLSARTYNILLFADITYLWQIALKDESELMTISGMDPASAAEINRLTTNYIKDNLWEKLAANTSTTAGMSIYDVIKINIHNSLIKKYVQANDILLGTTTLSNRAKNQLANKGYTKLSDIVLMSHKDLSKLKNVGESTVDDTCKFINEYLDKHSDRILRYIDGDETSIYDDDSIRDMILKLYESIAFAGLSFSEIKEQLALPEFITDDRIKSVIGRLIADNELEYVDFRCHRVYEKFTDRLDKFENITHRNKDIINRRLSGETLESLGNSADMSKEGIRRILHKEAIYIKADYTSETGLEFFDEDYYRYFFENYEIDKKDAVSWLGLPAHAHYYFEFIGVHAGDKDLAEALEDPNIRDAALRFRIKNYLNRDKLYIDGIWVPKKRSDLEEIVLRKFCGNRNVPLNEFVDIYNNYLDELGIVPEENLHHTEQSKQTAKNRLITSRCTLWTLNEQVRYYDIDSRDYTELLDTLCLDTFENVEISTLKLFRMYPDVMDKYNIRDHYELHNLLRKIVQKNSYNGFECGRTPHIKFGTFDRDKAIFAILCAHSPISAQDLADLVHEEYGYENGVTLSSYLPVFNKYYHKGIYTIDQKKMDADTLSKVSAALTGDFYYLNEIEQIYTDVTGNTNLEEINPYNLKVLGFQIFSKYVLKGHSSLESYFEKMFTDNDVTDLTYIKKRYSTVQVYYNKLLDLKKELEVIEFQPDQLIHIRKLEASGITKDMLYEFCDAVYDYVKDDKCFSIRSIRQDGFTHELFDSGLDDWFFGSVLLSDNRLSRATIYNNKIFSKATKDITAKSFEYELIKEHKCIDIYDLQNELTDRFGCNPDRYDIVEKIQGSGAYYDRILERFYASADIYYHELDETGGM